MNDPAARQTMLAGFDEIIARLGESGASAKAARAIVQELEGTSEVIS
jgi:hypothetical protein